MLRVDPDVVQALELAMAHSGVDVSARAYAHGMERALVEHGLEGIEWNVLYLLSNLELYRGPEARQVKKILRHWTAVQIRTRDKARRLAEKARREASQ